MRRLILAALVAAASIFSLSAAQAVDICPQGVSKADYVAFKFCGWQHGVGPAADLNWGQSSADAQFQSRGDVRKMLYKEGALDNGCTILEVGFRNLKDVPSVSFIATWQRGTAVVSENVEDRAANVSVVVCNGEGTIWAPVSALTADTFLQISVSEQARSNPRLSVTLTNNNPDGGGFTNPKEHPDADRFVDWLGKRRFSATRLNLTFLRR